MIAIYFFILSFATWRVSKMLVDEVGPYKAIERFRNAIINKPWSPIHCFNCTSIWVAFFLSMMLHLPFELFVLHWFAASGVAMFMRIFFERVE